MLALLAEQESASNVVRNRNFENRKNGTHIFRGNVLWNIKEWGARAKKCHMVCPSAFC